MSRAIAEFLEHLAVERRMSANTLDAYRRDLDALAQWCGAGGGDVESIDGEGVRAFEGDWDAYKEYLAESTAPAEKEAPAVKNAYVLAKERKSAFNRAKTAMYRAEARVKTEEHKLAELEQRNSF